jgi:hypothetical protein
MASGQTNRADLPAHLLPTAGTHSARAQRSPWVAATPLTARPNPWVVTEDPVACQAARAMYMRGGM